MAGAARAEAEEHELQSVRRTAETALRDCGKGSNHSGVAVRAGDNTMEETARPTLFPIHRTHLLLYLLADMRPQLRLRALMAFCRDPLAKIFIFVQISPGTETPKVGI